MATLENIYNKLFPFTHFHSSPLFSAIAMILELNVYQVKTFGALFVLLYYKLSLSANIRLLLADHHDKRAMNDQTCLTPIYIISPIDYDR